MDIITGEIQARNWASRDLVLEACAGEKSSNLLNLLGGKDYTQSKQLSAFQHKINPVSESSPHKPSRGICTKKTILHSRLFYAFTFRKTKSYISLNSFSYNFHEFTVLKVSVLNSQRKNVNFL